MIRFISVFLCSLIVAHAAFAAPKPQQPAPTVGLVTGPATGTYIRIGNDIAGAAQRYGVKIDVKESQGSIENLKRINSRENASLGIVQSDLLGYLRRSQEPETKKLAENLRLVFPFYQEEVHVLARTTVKNFQDLNGKRVVVGEVGSGHWLTSMNLLTMYGIKPVQLLRLAPAEAVAAVLKNQADAMVFVGGKPVKLFQNLDEIARVPNSPYKELLKQVHFVPLQDQRLQNEYAVSTVTPQDYTFQTTPVPTIAVRAMLVSYDFSHAGKGIQKAKCDAIGKIGAALKHDLPKLQQQGHGKWQEVSLTNPDVGLWERDQCVDNYRPTETVAGADNIEKDLLNVIKQRW